MSNDPIAIEIFENDKAMAEKFLETPFAHVDKRRYIAATMLIEQCDREIARLKGEPNGK